MIEDIDWALDPNSDGDISDAVDIVNMSLGQSYAQEQDDSTVAINNMVRPAWWRCSRHATVLTGRS